MQYVGFWVRLAAYFIDMLVAMLIGFVLGFVIGFAGAVMQFPHEHAMMMSQIVGIPIWYLYSAIFLSSSYQATPGKMAVGAVVVKEDGGKLTFWNALGRTLAQIVSAIILCIGFVMIAFTQRKRGLHDIMAGTVVIKKSSIANTLVNEH